MASYADLIPVLSAALSRLGDGPLSVHVSLCDAEIVADLKSRVAVLEQENEELTARCNRAEFEHRCNSIVCMRVLDYCREHGFVIPRSVYKGIDSF